MTIAPQLLTEWVLFKNRPQVFVETQKCHRPVHASLPRAGHHSFTVQGVKVHILVDSEGVCFVSAMASEVFTYKYGLRFLRTVQVSTNFLNKFH